MTNIQEEIWKPIQGFEHLYKISNLGKVISLHFKEEKFNAIVIGKKGYCATQLWDSGKHKTLKVHRLVAIHFVDNPLNKPEVNHKNGIKTDNRAENLEWSTRSENVLHAYRVLGCTNKKKIA